MHWGCSSWYAASRSRPWYIASWCDLRLSLLTIVAACPQIAPLSGWGATRSFSSRVVSLSRRTDASVRTHSSISWVGLGWVFVLHYLFDSASLFWYVQIRVCPSTHPVFVAFHVTCCFVVVVLLARRGFVSCRQSLHGVVTGCSSWLCRQPLPSVLHSELERLALFFAAHCWCGYVDCAIVGMGCLERFFKAGEATWAAMVTERDPERDQC